MSTVDLRAWVDDLYMQAYGAFSWLFERNVPMVVRACNQCVAMLFHGWLIRWHRVDGWTGSRWLTGRLLSSILSCLSRAPYSVPNVLWVHFLSLCRMTSERLFFCVGPLACLIPSYMPSHCRCQQTSWCRNVDQTVGGVVSHSLRLLSLVIRLANRLFPEGEVLLADRTCYFFITVSFKAVL